MEERIPLVVLLPFVPVTATAPKRVWLDSSISMLGDNCRASRPGKLEPMPALKRRIARALTFPVSNASGDVLDRESVIVTLTYLIEKLFLALRLNENVIDLLGNIGVQEFRARFYH